MDKTVTRAIERMRAAREEAERERASASAPSETLYLMGQVYALSEAIRILEEEWERGRAQAERLGYL